MKTHYFSFLPALLLLVFTSSMVGENMLSIGEKAPMVEHKMQDAASGKDLTLSDVKKENGLLVIFTCNTCPFVLGWEDQYPELGEMTAQNDIGMLLVNSNEAKRDKEDSMEAMKKHYKEAGYNSPYVLDKNNQLADAMGAATTPHVYLFNGDMELVYRGSINDKYEKRGEDASNFYLKDALEALAKGEKIDPATTRQIGCSIKRA